MKKKINILAHICMMCTTLSLAGCGGGNSNNIDVSMAKFTDEGISAIYLKGCTRAEYEEWDKNGRDQTQFGSLLQDKGKLYSNWVEGAVYETTELKKGEEWSCVVTIDFMQGYSLGDINLEFNNKECHFTRIDDMFGGSYFTVLDSFITEDVQLKLKGKSTLMKFQPTVNLKNYNTCLSGQACQNLRFTVGVGELEPNASNDSPITFETLEHNSKMIFTAEELKEVLESKSYTYYEAVKVSAFFIGNAHFFPDRETMEKFFGVPNYITLDDDWEISWILRHGDNGGGSSQATTLDYSVFSSIEPDSMSNISLSCNSFVEFPDLHYESEPGGGSINRFSEGSYKYIVDDVEKNTLTLSDLNRCKNLKLKLEITQLMATIIKDDNVIVRVGDKDANFDIESETEWNVKEFQSNELLVSNDPVPGKPGYYYLTLDLGDWKTNKNQNRFLDMCIHINADSQHSQDINNLLANEIKGLNKVEFVFDDSSTYSGHTLAPFRSNVNELDIMGDGANGSRSFGCYYIEGNDLEVEIDDITFSSGQCNKLKLSITKEDNTVEEVFLNYTTSDNAMGVWKKDASDTHDLVTVEYVERTAPDYGTSNVNKVTIKNGFGTITKIETTLVDWTEI